jgi:ABC-type polysaccharide/polyol phosphate export permease
VELREFLPHVTVSIVIWQLMSGMLTDASGTFSGNKHLLLSQRLACSTLIVSMIYKNVLAFIHNCLVVVIVFAIFGQTPNWQVILLPIALALLVVCAVWVCYVTALGCTRFRDFNYAMQTVLQLAFYVTPVIWKPEFLGEQYQWVLYCNPFAIFMTIIRSCFVGGPFPVIEWLLAVAITFGGFLIALPVIGKYRRQLLFWV